MPIDIILDDTPGFSNPPTSGPFINGWEFDPAPELQFTYVMGAAVPAAVNVATLIENYIAQFPSVDIRVKVLMGINVPYTPVNWLAVTGEIASAGTGGYDLTEENLEVTTTLTLQNLSLLQEGVYTVAVYFNVTDNGTPPEFYDSIAYNVRLTVINPNAILLDPEVLNFSFLREGDLPTAQNLEVSTASTWTLTTDKIITVSGTGLTDLSTATQTIIQGTGNKTLSIGFAAGLNDVPSDTFYAELQFENTAGYSSTAVVNVVIFESETFVFDPPTLSFFAIVNLLEATPLSFNVFGFGAFTLTAPAWLNLSATSGTNTGTFIATPQPTTSMSEGVYQGNIVLTAGEDEYVLPVTYIIAGTIYTPLDDGNFNFTKDVEYFNVYNVNEGSNWQLSNVLNLGLNIVLSAYTTFAQTVEEFSHVLPFYQNLAKKHLGEIVERLMPKPKSLQDFGISSLNNVFQTVLPVYRLAVVDANVGIFNKVDQEFVFEEAANGMKFIAGKKPEAFGDNKGILSHCTLPKRVTQESKEIINFVVDTGYYKIEHQKNEEDPVTVLTQYTAGHNIFRYWFDFSQYGPGDKIKVIISANGTAFSKEFILLPLPESGNSAHIAFVSQFLTVELLECTGSFTLESDIKATLFKKYQDLVEQLEQVRSDKTVSLKINTGFLFKQDQLVIDEILRSRKVWLLMGDETPIEMVPKDKQLVNYDSDLELYEYELEFEINKANDVSTYTF